MAVPDKTKATSFHRARFARIYYLDQQLRAGKYPNVPRLARELEVQARTIERDIEHMRDRLGAPIAYDHKQKGYYYTSDGFRLPPLRLTEGEMVALFLGQKLLAQCAGTPLEEPVRSAFEKVCTLLPVGISVDFDTLEQAISFNLEPLRGDERRIAEIYHRLAGAIQHKATVWVRYYSAARNEFSQRHIDPYHLRYFHGAWYLIAFCHWRKELRVFAIDRIQELRETGATFTPIPDFSLEDFLGGSLGIEVGEHPEEVAIRFDSHQARWIRERRWHQTQTLKPQPDGSLILRMTVSGLGEVKRWVLSFGSHAEVLAPESLRREVSQELKKAVTLYEPLNRAPLPSKKVK